MVVRNSGSADFNTIMLELANAPGRPGILLDKCSQVQLHVRAEGGKNGQVSDCAVQLRDCKYCRLHDSDFGFKTTARPTCTVRVTDGRENLVDNIRARWWTPFAEDAAVVELSAPGVCEVVRIQNETLDAGVPVDRRRPTVRILNP